MAAGFIFIATSANSGFSLYEADYQADMYWSGYLLPPQAGTPPESISYTDSLRSVLNRGAYTALYAGSFLFASTRPPALNGDPASFIDGVVSYLQSQKLIAGSQTVLWIPAVDPLTFGQPFAAYCLVF